MTDYPNERALVDKFVWYTVNNLITLFNGKERRVFIWGYEAGLLESKS